MSQRFVGFVDFYRPNMAKLAKKLVVLHLFSRESVLSKLTQHIEMKIFEINECLL